MNPKKNSGMIGQLSVSSDYDVIVYGSVRGLVSAHRAPASAVRSLERDQAGCRSQGGYSDASVYCITDDGWREVDVSAYAR